VQLNMGLLLITQDLGVVWERTQRVMVMYVGVPGRNQSDRRSLRSTRPPLYRRTTRLHPQAQSECEHCA
jgi:ABC-type dipeptide/oligopeptide/nickel transport system ATPase component